MKIKSVEVNNRKKCLFITTAKGGFSLPFSKLEEHPSSVLDAYVDKELGHRAITYTLDGQKEGSVHVDAFLEYWQDPEHLKRLTLYKLTLLAQRVVKVSQLTKREIARKLNTSPAHLYRLLDSANYAKTIDQLFKLLASLGYELDFVRHRGGSQRAGAIASY